MPQAQTHQTLSEILTDVCEHPDEHVTVGELTIRFGDRALGAMIFVFGLACTLPLPPGSSTIFGAPLVVLAPQLAIGSPTPWLPAKVRARRLAVEDLAKGLARILPWLRRFEALSRPRLPILFAGWGQRAIGVVCTVLALVLILPIPLGNLLPGFAVAVLSFSIVQRDGLLALLGYALAATSAGVLVIAAHIVIQALQHFATMLSHA